MNNLIIKKCDGKFYFACSLNNLFNRANTKLNKFNIIESDIQYISNKKHLVFYLEKYVADVMLLKVLFEDELSKIDDLDNRYLRFELTKKIKDVLKEHYRLNESNPKEGNSEYNSGYILILTNDHLYLIDPDFGVKEHVSYIDCKHRYKALDNCLNNPSPLELFNAIAQEEIENSNFKSYPKSYGCFPSDTITVETIDGNKKDFALEDFVCHW